MTYRSVAFGEIFEIQLGKMLDEKKNVGEPRLYLANRDVQWGRCDVSALGSMRFTESDRARFRLRKGDLLVCEGGEVGRTAVWNDEIAECYYQKAIHRLRPLCDVESRYILHYMRWAADQRLFGKLTSSTSIAHLTKTKLAKFSIPLPPLAEQKRIAAILDAADALRARRREALAQLDSLLQATFLEMFGDPVTNPMGWERLVLDSFCRPKQWPTIGKNELLAQGYPVFGANGQIGYYSSFNHLNETVLITCRGATCGTINVCPPMSYVTGNAMALDDLKEDRVHLRFLQHALARTDFRAVITGVAQPQITRQSLQQLSVAVPPIALQSRFAAIVESVELQKTSQSAHLAELDTLFASLQSRAFRGEL